MHSVIVVEKGQQQQCKQTCIRNLVYSSLLAAKACLAKKGLTTPRLELISAHMAANLVDNVTSALEGYLGGLCSVYGWTDSTEVLYWTAEKGSYKQFVSNRVAQINATAYVKGRYTGTEQRHLV